MTEDFDDNQENKTKLWQESAVPGDCFMLFSMSSEVRLSVEMCRFSQNAWDIDNNHERQQPSTTAVFEEEDMLVCCMKNVPETRFT